MNKYQQQLNRVLSFVEAHGNTSDKLAALEVRQAATEQVVSVPNEHGKNRYGLDMAYFRNLFNRELNRPLVDFKPSELARVLARASRTADSSVLLEPEFQAEQGDPDRCVHGIRHPHECDQCADSVETEDAVAWQAFESVADILEPYIVRSPNSKGFLPDSIVESVQILLEYRLEHSAEQGVPDGWRAEIEKAIKLASVFDDGGDGADDESARSVVGILSALLAAQQPPGAET